MKVKCVQIRSPLPESDRYSTTAAVSIGERAKCVAPYAEPQYSAVLGSARQYSAVLGSTQQCSLVLSLSSEIGKIQRP